MIKAIFFRIFVIMLSVAAALCLAELVLRLLDLPPYPDRMMSRVYLEDPQTGFVYLPNSQDIRSAFEFKTTMKINSLGLRDRDDMTFHDDVPVFVCGDSFAMGHGVESRESFPKQLERILGVGVADLGVNSYGTREELVLLDRYIGKFSKPPSTVILAFYVGNDYLDNLLSENAPTHSVSDGYLVDRGKNIQAHGDHIELVGPKGEKFDEIINGQFHPAVSAGWPFLRQSKIYNIISSWLYGAKGSRDFLIRHHWAQPRPASLPIAIPGFFRENRFLDNPHWSKTQPLIDKFLQKVKAIHAEPLVVIIPSKYQLFPELVAKYPAHWDPARIDTDSSMSVLAHYLKSQNADYIDLLSEFRKLPLAEQRRLYFSGDDHFSKEGHLVCARLIALHLKKTAP